jgi:hypothetical protein
MPATFQFYLLWSKARLGMTPPHIEAYLGVPWHVPLELALCATVHRRTHAEFTLGPELHV